MARRHQLITWGAHVANASLLALLTRTLTTPAILHATPVLVWPEPYSHSGGQALPLSAP